MTITDALSKAAERTFIVFLLIGGAMCILWFSTPMTHNAGTSEDIMAIRPHAEGTVGYAIEANDCVKHYGDNLPTGVVYQDKTGRAHYSSKPVVIGKALDAALGGKEWPSHTVNIFCK